MMFMMHNNTTPKDDHKTGLTSLDRYQLGTFTVYYDADSTCQDVDVLRKIETVSKFRYQSSSSL